MEVARCATTLYGQLSIICENDPVKISPSTLDSSEGSYKTLPARLTLRKFFRYDHRTKPTTGLSPGKNKPISSPVPPPLTLGVEKTVAINFK